MVSIPSALTTKFAGDQAPSLRSICEQCEGVHIRFANKSGKNQSNRTAAKKLSHMDIIVLGPEKEVDQACALLAELNAKVSELCAEVSVEQNQHNLLENTIYILCICLTQYCLPFNIQHIIFQLKYYKNLGELTQQ
ncbi:unnamed protein product [Trichobilharzia regenti]|nr:unnamed protein product [Trichobilharzia regenti]